MTDIKWINRIFGAKSDNSGALVFEKCSVLNIPCDNIRPNRARARADFDEDKMLRLAASIRRYGIIQPLTVRKTDLDDLYEYELIAGERRLRAAKLLGLYCVPCIVIAVDDKQIAELAIAENIVRADLNMFEIAYALRELIDEHGLSLEDVAKELSVSQAFVSAKLRLLKLGYEEQRAIIELSLTEDHARALLRLTSSGERMKVIRKISEEFMTARETEEYIDRLIEKDKTETFDEVLACASKTTATAVRTIQKRIEALQNSGKDIDMDIRASGGYIELRVRVER